MINNTIIMTDNSGEVSVTKDIKLYTVQEVADILGVNKTAIYGLVKRGELPAIKLGTTKIRHSALVLFLDKIESDGYPQPECRISQTLKGA